MKLIVNIIGIALMCSSIAASAYLCPSVNEVKCSNGECVANDMHSGHWTGSSDTPVNQFYHVINSHSKIHCLYWNESGTSFEMSNAFLDNFILQIGQGPWKEVQKGVYECDYQKCEFVPDPAEHPL